MKTKELAEQIFLEVEGLEERIAPTLAIDSLLPVSPTLDIVSGETETTTTTTTTTEDGNNGWGNGEDTAPGSSVEAQPGFEDPNTGASPSSSPESADGDR